MLCPLICFTKKTLPLPEGVTQQGDAVRKSLCCLLLAVRMAGGVSLHGIPPESAYYAGGGQHDGGGSVALGGVFLFRRLTLASLSGWGCGSGGSDGVAGFFADKGKVEEALLEVGALDTDSYLVA